MQKPKQLRLRKYTCKLYQKTALEYLNPPEDMKVSEWAETYRILDSKTSAEPGPWSNKRTPYLVDIMDEFLNYETEEIIFCKCTQVGGTEVELNMLGYAAQQDPAPVEIVYPTETLANSISEKRIKPMIESAPTLYKKYDRNSGNLELDFDDMFIKLVWSNSPSGLASFAVKYLFLDEVDKYPGASKKEADPISLAKERTKTFRNSKIYITSTPTIRTNHIWKAKEGADVEKHYFIPCPHCNEFIELKFDNLKWPGKDKDLVEAYGKEAIKEKMDSLEIADENLSNADRAEFAFYVCQECGCVISDAQKQTAIKKGRWEVVRKQTRFVKKVCFWINTLYSPFVRFSEIAKEFMESKSDPEKLQNFVNSWLAEPWEDTKLKTSAELVLERQTELTEFIVPAWAKLLTGGVDVQQNCLYWTIRAWGDFITSQNIAHGQAYDFKEIENIMNLQYMTEDGNPMVVSLCLIDSGYDADSVYDFCAYNSDWALPCKGSNNPMKSHFLISTVNKDYSKAYGMNLVMVDGEKYKDMIAGRLHKENGRGSWMVYKGCDLEYAEQVTSEHKINVKAGNGKTRLKWVPKHSHAQNHYLDCECYAMAAADTLGLRGLYLRNTPETSTEKREQYTPEEDWINQNENWL
ncbi:MAG: phage terminase large subunit family protein [Lachnospiraceae bacterium]|nr:phage terminase large subunit family protein [Lachnospiraceae bacterium]